jgi:hypothetical protein
VWFEGGGQRSASFTFTAAQTHAGDVLVLAAEDYSGSHPGPPHAGPEYLSAYTDASGTRATTYSCATPRTPPTRARRASSG